MNPADPVTKARFAIATPRCTCTALYSQDGRGEINPLQVVVLILAANTQGKGGNGPPP